MTTLVVQDMDNNTEIDLEIRIYRSMYLKNTRVHLFKQGTLTDGVLDLDIYDGATLVGTKQITYTQINTIPGSYFHGWVSFEFDEPIFLSKDPTSTFKEYIFKFTLSGHTDDDDIYLGLCRDYEKYVRNTVAEYRNAPLYGIETGDGLTALANNHPIAVELYTQS